MDNWMEENMQTNDPVFQSIDLENWPRKATFDHYYHHVVCSYSITAEIEIGHLLQRCKEKSLKLYPVMIYLIACAVNQIPELKFSFNEQGDSGFWNFLSPCYTIFHDDDKSFSNIWTPFHSNFSVFMQRYLQDTSDYGGVKDFIAKPNTPLNTFPVSCIPWVDFTGFNLNIYSDWKYLRPIFTLGKFTRHEKGVKIPLAAQLHHAICDGYHAGLLFERIKEQASNPDDWIQL